MKRQTKTLVILDAHAIIHRAYHALPSFANSQGVPTGALYGLSAMLIRIIEELKPDYIVAAYDLPKPTFRHHAYGAYKDGRAKADDDLVTQLQSSREIFSAFGILTLDAEGFEADDVIGTLVAQFKDTPELDIVIASGDMDTLQLVEGRKVRVFTLKRGVNDTVMYDEDGVRERFGFGPRQLIDYKGLRGDPSDNIIGVRGIGEKTATTIVQHFGSIERLYEALEANSPELKEIGLTDRIIGILREGKDDALFSKTLSTIRIDAPVTFALPDTCYKEHIDTDALITELSRFEFRSLIPRVRNLFAIDEVRPTEEIDPMLLREASIALWVLYSDTSNPTYDMILDRTRKKTLSEAHTAIMAELDKRSLRAVYEEIERPLIPIIAEMESRGIAIDKDHFTMLRARLKTELARIESEVTACTGSSINLNSPKQLSELLFDTLRLKPKGKRKASGAYTTNAEALEELRDDHPVIPLLLQYRELQKLLTTYIEALLGHVHDDGRLHATFYQHGTTTGRFSSADPNLQNLPAKGEFAKEIRHGFVAAPGHVFIGSDYSQIELRVLAILSGDETLKEVFRTGKDIHARVASSVFNVPMDKVTPDMRRAAKVINFGILYGMGVTALQKNLGTTREKAQTFYREYFESFPSIAAYLDSTKDHAKQFGYTETLFGRRRYFPSINSGAAYVRAFAERMASNAPIQGTAADIIKLAIRFVDEDLARSGIKDKVHLVLQVHDELVYEVEQTVADQAHTIIKEAMNSVLVRSPIPQVNVNVPLDVSMGSGARLDEIK